ncbi:MAG TPA: copper-binding protein [Ramlibacter sp.]|nr:copper-binding protein [Ramlibacter sp.]
MKALRHLLIAGAVGSAAAIAVLAHAQAPSGHDQAAPVKVAKADMTEGEVRKVDKAKKTITLKHGAIKNLDMPPMTMVFEAADPSLLGKVKAGDKVRFVAANPGGKLTVTEIQPAQ